MAPGSFADDQTRVMHVAVISVFSFFALVAVIFRLWARRIQKNVLEANDYLILPGLVWALGLCIFTIHSNVYWDLGGNLSQYGNGEAIGRLVVLQGKSLIVGQITWAVSVFFIRASILALYIRIFRTRSFRITCWMVVGINAAFFVATVLAACLICRPISLNWDHSDPSRTCGDQKSLDIFIGVFNLIMDVTVVVLPMPVLWGLQMAIGKKVVLSGMFGMGIIICIITLIRTQISGENHGSNSAKVYSLVALFTCLEALLGVINACLPVMKPVFNKLGDSRASAWISSVMSGSIPVFMRLSQMASTKDASSKETTRWPRGMKRQSGVPPALPQYVNKKPANISISSPSGDLTRKPSISSPDSIRPPVPPKSKYYKAGPAKRWECEKGPGIYVRRDWDVEREGSDETDRIPLKDIKGGNDYNKW